MEARALEGEAVGSIEQTEEEALTGADTTYYDESGDYQYAYYDDENTPIVNNYYYADVYQDNYPSFTTRIGRFHEPYYGHGYYDPWFNDPWYYD